LLPHEKKKSLRKKKKNKSCFQTRKRKKKKDSRKKHTKKRLADHKGGGGGVFHRGKTTKKKNATYELIPREKLQAKTYLVGKRESSNKWKTTSFSGEFSTEKTSAVPHQKKEEKASKEVGDTKKKNAVV